jgi:hypothetical protein
METLLERLATPTEDGKLIYRDILCMSWAAVYDPRNALSHEPDSKVTDAETRAEKIQANAPQLQPDLQRLNAFPQ